ncbi:MAG: hypothetical protein GWO24_18035 [Akkermansiaceae bacterium]|nr:hypothetical protein [Akkermansiaceae bacterium]
MSRRRYTDKQRKAWVAKFDRSSSGAGRVRGGDELMIKACDPALVPGRRVSFRGDPFFNEGGTGLGGQREMDEINLASPERLTGRVFAPD